MNLQRSFKRENKGIGTVFGMVFFLLIVMVVFASFMVILNQDTSYQQTVKKARQMDNDRANEQLTISPQTDNAIYQIDTDTNSVTVNVDIVNKGTLIVQLKTLWVEDLSLSDPTSVFIQITGAESTFAQGQQNPDYSGAVSFPSSVQIGQNDQFRFWFITARGNQFTLQQTGFSQTLFNQYLSEVFGDFLPDYHSVQWGVINQVGSQFQVSTWTQGWVIPVNTEFNLAWRIDCSYYGANPITIDQNTMLFFVPSSPRNGGGHALNPFMSYIVKETTSGPNIILNQYPGNEITVQPLTKMTLYFAVLDPGAEIVSDNLFSNSVYQDTAAAMMSLTLYGKSPSTYAQSFPLFAVLPRV